MAERMPRAREPGHNPQTTDAVTLPTGRSHGIRVVRDYFAATT